MRRARAKASRCGAVTWDPILESNLTRRVEFALFMVEALTNDELVHETPAIVGVRTTSALAHAATRGDAPPAVAT